MSDNASYKKIKVAGWRSSLPLLSSAMSNYAIFLGIVLVVLLYSKPPTKSVKLSRALECKLDGVYNTWVFIRPGSKKCPSDSNFTSLI